LTVVRDRNHVTQELPAVELQDHLGDWVWDAKDSSKARKAFEHPELEFLQDFVAERAAEFAGDRYGVLAKSLSLGVQHAVLGRCFK
jgi:hypothetical protein